MQNITLSPASMLHHIHEESDARESTLSFLALGDSYTIGESVPYHMNFPSQLSDALQKNHQLEIDLEIVATTGWRTDELIGALESFPEKASYDLVTLLIGVNNQYQDKPFRQYKKEFHKLLLRAIALAGADKTKVFVISIPDYAFTPFAKPASRPRISREIDRYNQFAMKTAEANGVKFISVTGITRKGLEQPELVAGDGLHPSGAAYSLFVKEIMPVVEAQWRE